MILNMLPKRFSRQIVALTIAFGVLLGGVAPSWAISAASVSGAVSQPMPGMDMQNDCMDAMQQGVPTKNLPAKNTATCGMCTACSLPVLLQASLIELLYVSNRVVFGHDMNKSGIATLPALPPPIA